MGVSGCSYQRKEAIHNVSLAVGSTGDGDCDSGLGRGGGSLTLNQMMFDGSELQKEKIQGAGKHC